MKKLDYKKLLIFGLSIIINIVLFVSLILFFISSKKTIPTVSSDAININTNLNLNNDLNMHILVPNVTNENTEFKVSDTSKKAEIANICAQSRLSEYNLYYCIKFGNSNNSEINNEDYILFNDLILLIEENCSILFKYELNGNFSSEPYIVEISNIENKKDKESTEKVSEKDLEKEKVDKEDSTQSTSHYFIKVNYKANVVTIYSKDKDGNYTVPYKAMVCSCGTYTPKNGTYKTSNKYVWRPLINNVYGHYATRIVNKILFHSVPYTSSSNDALEYWEYDKLGETASEGCVRLTVQDAKWIYNNCPSGTMVEFYSDSNPGPLGKPSAKKISSNVECRDWDPTDPAEGNPWRTYKPKEEENANVNNTVNNSITNSINNSVVNNSISNNIGNSSNSNNNTSNNIVNTTINNSVNDVNANTNINNNSLNNNSTNNTVVNNVTSNTSVNNVITNNSSNNVNNNINNTSNNSINNTSINSAINNTIPD